MRYLELFERDYSKIINSLRDMIDHPSTEPELRDAAQRRLKAILDKRVDRQNDILAARKAKKEKEEAEARQAADARAKSVAAAKKADAERRERAQAAKAEMDLKDRKAKSATQQHNDAQQSAFFSRRSKEEMDAAQKAPRQKFSFQAFADDNRPENEDDESQNDRIFKKF